MQTYYRNEKVVVAGKMAYRCLLVINMDHGLSRGNYSGLLFLLIAGINARNEGKRESHGNVAFALGVKVWAMGKAQQLWKKQSNFIFRVYFTRDLMSIELW